MISFAASLGSWTPTNGSNTVDEDRAYGLITCLYIGARSIQMMWGGILAFCLASAAQSKLLPVAMATKAILTSKQN